uniref:Uncharacterized protein n=1 Tax=Anopheles stephensi TaxID=30069 RepID=A0A182YMF4_ANOST
MRGSGGGGVEACVAEGSVLLRDIPTHGSIVLSPPLAREASTGVRFGVPLISATMLNSLETLAGKISPGSGKNSPSAPNGATTGGGELIDSNGNNKLLSGYHLRTKLPYQKPGLSNNNNNCNVVNNTPAAAGIVPGGGVPLPVGLLSPQAVAMLGVSSIATSNTNGNNGSSSNLSPTAASTVATANSHRTANGTSDAMIVDDVQMMGVSAKEK